MARRQPEQLAAARTVSSASDLYERLGITRSASSRQIRQALRALRRAGDGDGLRDFVCIADQVLREPTQRIRYNALIDRLRAAGLPIPTIGNVAGPDFEAVDDARIERNWIPIKVVAVVCVVVAIIAVIVVSA